MEIIFSYKTAKHTLVLTAYMALIMFDCYWIGFIIINAIKWVVKKIKGLFKKKTTVEEKKEDATNE